MTYDLDAHIARATSVRFDPNFVKMPAGELLGLVDHVIACARAGVQITEQERESIKPFCAAADAHANTHGPVILRSEDYYHLVELAKRVATARSELSPPNTTPPPYQLDVPAPEPAAMPTATPEPAAPAAPEPSPKPKRRRRTPAADKTDDHAT